MFTSSASQDEPGWLMIAAAAAAAAEAAAMAVVVMATTVAVLALVVHPSMLFMCSQRCPPRILILRFSSELQYTLSFH